MNDEIYFPWQLGDAVRKHRTAVSLHSHTLHSKESLRCLDAVLDGNAVLRLAAGLRTPAAKGFCFRRAYWRPPLSPWEAWNAERKAIEQLDVAALVSLSDHDDIEAPMHLLALEASKDIPVSVEWTVPYGEAVFHLGVHNLPVREAHALMQAMGEVSSGQRPGDLLAVLDWICSSPDALVVFNHPCWDEEGVGAERHRRCRDKFIEAARGRIHALELNGLRPWSENRQVAALAKALAIPLVSGGDRHARRPNAVLNLTNASSFSEFVREVREQRRSLILVQPHGMESFRLRVVQSLCEILRDDPDHSLGWRLWSDRIFYESEDGAVRSLTQIWGANAPPVVRHFVNLVRMADRKEFRPVLRLVFAERDAVRL